MTEEQQLRNALKIARELLFAHMGCARCIDTCLYFRDGECALFFVSEAFLSDVKMELTDHGVFVVEEDESTE